MNSRRARRFGIVTKLMPLSLVLLAIPVLATHLVNRMEYYVPTTRGFEKELGRRLAAWRRIKSQRMAERGTPGAGGEEPGGTT